MRRSTGHGFALTIAALSVVMASSTAEAADTTDIVVIGGPSVVSDAVLEHLETCTTGTVSRIAGSNRYATAAAVSTQTFPTADTVYLATGLNFPDALAAGPVAAANGAPILLVRTDSVPSETLDEIDRLKP
ncbi:MAG: cell wall-binding repeat-containing protein, partial [Actinomycetota bacterium]|nr:cell wall-binding repeat-containing protein [Actinomycetota bacterium]